MPSSVGVLYAGLSASSSGSLQKPYLTPASADEWADCPCSDYVPVVMKADSKTADLRWAVQLWVVYS